MLCVTHAALRQGPAILCRAHVILDLDTCCRFVSGVNEQNADAYPSRTHPTLTKCISALKCAFYIKTMCESRLNGLSACQFCGQPVRIYSFTNVCACVRRRRSFRLYSGRTVSVYKVEVVMQERAVHREILNVQRWVIVRAAKNIKVLMCSLSSSGVIHRQSNNCPLSSFLT